MNATNSDQIAKLCQSPIETLFLDAWVKNIDSWGESADSLFGFPPLKRFTDIVPHLSRSTILHRGVMNFTWTQERIGEYRADFVIGRVGIAWFEDGNPDHFVEYIRRLPLIVVECDGHDYHERTKEQAARDRNRDRQMQLDGFRVVRFTGSELFNDADVCASMVRDLFTTILRTEIPDLSGL